MSRKPKGPRLWLRAARYDAAGQLTHKSAWFIKDGDSRISTGFGASEFAEAEKALADYLADKHTGQVTRGTRDPDAILIDEVLALYVRDKVADQARPDETAKRIEFLRAFWGGHKLSYVTGVACRQYARQRSTPAAARRELEDLRSAINHHRREGLHDKLVSVVLPAKSLPRERWLTRSEAARLVWRAWRYREQQNFRGTDRRTRKHVARFILVALYTGSRSGVVCSATFKRTEGRPWVDVDRGVLHRRAAGERETNKRKPAIKLAAGLVAHMRRWSRNQLFVVEWNGNPVEHIRAFAAAVADAGLGDDVTPHTLRHTAATWLMMANANLWEASGYLGMTVETLQRVYGHFRPEHNSGVRKIIERSKERTGTGNS
jgi:integrase